MMQRYGKNIVLLNPDKRKHLLEERDFYEAVYKHKKTELELIAQQIIETEIKKLLYDQTISEFYIVRMACENAISPLKDMLKGISFIRNYLASELVKGEDKELLLEEIARYVLED